MHPLKGFLLPSFLHLFECWQPDAASLDYMITANNRRFCFEFRCSNDLEFRNLIHQINFKFQFELSNQLQTRWSR